MASAASGGGGGSAGGLKTYFKTPEGRHKLQYEKTHSSAVVHYGHSGKTVSQVSAAGSVMVPWITFGDRVDARTGISVGCCWSVRLGIGRRVGMGVDLA
ncbi:hypothetical protein PR202_ga25102 [Eleusine coracana subsp. coracana]|uniref:Uncharacterized protein n=1 Tax=Eleusine coracana subsp. coracana TaxID=191504 RepID=A0AAV5DAH4_ELECO|nr:hypothetical protein PR202_ga25102 [Eleusine coracana subsp. coracana]